MRGGDGSRLLVRRRGRDERSIIGYMVGAVSARRVRTISAVASSAGWNSSTWSSSSVMSTGVPIDVFVENHDCTALSPSPTRSRSGTSDGRHAWSGSATSLRAAARSGSADTSSSSARRRGSAGDRDLAIERGEEVVGPLGEVLDARRHALGVQRDAVRRSPAARAGERRRRRGTPAHRVGHHDVPRPVDDDGRVRVVGVDQLLQRVANGGHRIVLERGLLVARGVAGGQQHRVALAQRDVEVLGQGEDELGRRLGLAGLDEAEVAGRDADVERRGPAGCVDGPPASPAASSRALAPSCRPRSAFVSVAIGWNLPARRWGAIVRPAAASRVRRPARRGR